ncbi:hypothetical protein DNH61_12205 [Paenibacillus sambharensis]|uniref:PDZ domain-containing protein n=1 Tax=Paenibacillus sambharensis TaxID=1803190 RepID=A0A2W1LUX3_9BACL|nr:PDZ domain-containing protein [Paenibacillus sambharensis]PZD95307.1 hypothetical protein DNH61_12205 [Paenibacillus sambharensis]
MIECPKDRSVNMTYIEAPLEMVWQAVATPHGSDCYLTNRVETTGDADHAKAGDRLTLYYGDITNRAYVMEVEPLKRFVLADAYESMAPDGTVDPFRVRTTYTFEAEGSFTKLVLEVMGFADNTHGQWFRECLEMGWRRSLANLKSVLELGMDLRTELFSYPRLGITNCTVNAEQGIRTGVREGQGNYLLDVFPGGPAQEAGLQAGDVIVAIDGVQVPDYRTYVKTISRYYGLNKLIEITYIRAGKECRAHVNASIEDQFTGLIEGGADMQELEKARRQQIANERSASGLIWSTNKEGATTYDRDR